MLLAQFYLHYYAVIEKKKTEKKKKYELGIWT